MSEHALVLATIDDPHLAEAIARALVEERLAACVQRTGIDSVYRWNDRLESTAEQLLLIKCRTADYAAIEARIRALHPYEEPEIVRLDIAGGSPSYLGWLGRMTER